MGEREGAADSCRDGLGAAPGPRPAWKASALAAGLAATAWLIPGGSSWAGPGENAASATPSEGLSRHEILATIEGVADWQLAHLPGRVARSGGRAQKVGGRSWVRCVFFTGVLAAHRSTGDRRYLDAASALAEGNRWRLGRRREHADDHCVGQVYVELYLLLGGDGRVGPTRQRFDGLVGRRRPTPLWSWADSLFMSPPVAAMLASATGEKRYLDWLVSSWRQSEAALYDRDERLWFRDEKYVTGSGSPGTRAATGRKVFWGRGNGWVLAGLGRVLPHLPGAHSGRPRLERAMRDLAGRLLELQGADGLWRSSLLDQAVDAGPEASASALITFGMAAGINQGVLDRQRFLPSVRRAWRGLAGLVEPGGRVGRVQPVGREPGPAGVADSAEFGAGAVLLAAEQMLLLAEE